MAKNSRMSKLSSKDDECIFSWKLFTGWDFLIGTLYGDGQQWMSIKLTGHNWMYNRVIMSLVLSSSIVLGHAETAHNRIASVVLSFKEALLEEAEKKKNKG